MSTTPTPPNGMVSNTELILRKILGEDVTPLPPNSRVEFYLTQVEEYIERLATGATRPIGETATPLTDGATTNPITIDGESYTAQINDLVFYGNKEFLFTVNGWREVGDLTNLNADMIDDSTTTNKFATQAQLDQINTNKNNISLITPVIGNKIQYSLAGTNWQKINDISIVVPAGKTAYFAVSATRSTENNLTGLAVVRGNTFSTDNTFCITENTAATNYFMLSTVGVRRNAGTTDETLNIFVRFAGNASGTSVTYFMYVL